jgi:hypothetical protein
MRHGLMPKAACMGRRSTGWSCSTATARHGDKTACGATLIAGQQASIDNI